MQSQTMVSIESAGAAKNVDDETGFRLLPKSDLGLRFIAAR
jgi:hypothetical protein